MPGNSAVTIDAVQFQMCSRRGWAVARTERKMSVEELEHTVVDACCSAGRIAQHALHCMPIATEDVSCKRLWSGIDEVDRLVHGFNGHYGEQWPEDFIGHDRLIQVGTGDIDECRRDISRRPVTLTTIEHLGIRYVLQVAADTIPVAFVDYPTIKWTFRHIGAELCLDGTLHRLDETILDL